MGDKLSRPPEFPSQTWQVSIEEESKVEKMFSQLLASQEVARLKLKPGISISTETSSYYVLRV